MDKMDIKLKGKLIGRIADVRVKINELEDELKKLENYVVDLGD